MLLGVTEMGPGGLMYLLSMVAIPQGADHFIAGLRSLVTGQYHDTLIFQGLQKAGMFPENACFVDNSISAILIAAGGGAGLT